MSQTIDKSRATILVVDDEDINVMLIRSILEANGYGVEEAYSGRECIAKVKAAQPALILLDILMPEMSGVEVCRTLRKELKVDIPVIFVTGDSDKETLDEAFDAGGMDYLVKPVNGKVLLARIESAMSHVK